VLHEGGAGPVDEEQPLRRRCGCREGLEEVVERVVGELAEVGVVGVRRSFGTASDERRSCVVGPDVEQGDGVPRSVSSCARRSARRDQSTDGSPSTATTAEP